MPLRCVDTENGNYLAWQFTPEGWAALKEANSKRRHLRMPCCGARVVLRRSQLGTLHFAHARRGECVTAPETAEHLLSKKTIAVAAEHAGWAVSTEFRGGASDEEQWVADVYAEKVAAKVAIEVQWSRQPDEATRFRQALYATSGVRGLWLFRQPGFPVEKAVPAFRIRFDAEQTVFHVMLPSPLHPGLGVSPKDQDDPHYWQQTVELSRFVTGALTGRLHFAPALNRTLPLEVSATHITCWRCHRETRIVTGLTFAAGKVLPGCADIHTSIYEFDAVADGAVVLSDLLPPQLLKQNGIGALKPRYSKASRRPYLSNGCVHCDALQGQFFDHEVAFDSTLTLSTDVLFDAAWAQHLQSAQRSINRWWFGSV